MSAITAKAQADGLAVELNLDAVLPLVLDLIADAFDNEPETVAGLLSDLARSRRDLHRALERAELGQVPDHVAADLGGQVDRLREDLEEQLTAQVCVELNHREVLALQQQLTNAAANTFFGRLGRAS